VLRKLRCRQKKLLKQRQKARGCRFAFVLLCASSLCSLAWAEEAKAATDAKPAATKPLTPSAQPDAAVPKETLFWLYGFLVMTACIVGYKVWKKGALVRTNSKQSKLQVLEMRVLGNKQFLLVVEYENQRMMLGVSPGIIQHLCFLGERSQAAIPSGQDLTAILEAGGHTPQNIMRGHPHIKRE